MYEDLKPCPFCGGEAERITLEDRENFGGDVITCTKCQASSHVEFGRKENLVNSWNRREAITALEAELTKQKHRHEAELRVWNDNYATLEAERDRLREAMEKIKNTKFHRAASSLNHVEIARQALGGTNADV